MIHEQYNCICCNTVGDAEQASFDSQFNGLTCPECSKNIIKVVAWLKHEGISRPMATTDVNQWNYKRFQFPQQNG